MYNRTTPQMHLADACFCGTYVSDIRFGSSANLLNASGTGLGAVHMTTCPSAPCTQPHSEIAYKAAKRRLA